MTLIRRGGGRALRAAWCAGAVAGLVLPACGSDDVGTEPVDGVVDVVAAFYPLQYVAERVGGTAVRVTNVTPAGAEPHDVELSAKDVAAVRRSDLVVYLAGFSAAVDDAVGTVPDLALEVGAVAELDLEGDPHFWLDPTKLAAVADAVARRLSDLNPGSSATFTANAASLRADLMALDAAYTEALANCRSTNLVTSHEAFGYLAARYGLTQVAISGLTPGEEPTPTDLVDIARFVKANDVRTIYAETLVSTATASTVAAETGAIVAVLDPLEGLADGAAGDYLAVMRVNLATLRQGQGCP